MTEEQIAQGCPFCLRNCNCKACLRMEGAVKVSFSVLASVKDLLLYYLYYRFKSLQLLQNQMRDSVEISNEEKIEHSWNLLMTILPFLKQFDQEEITEKEVEAKFHGITYSVQVRLNLYFSGSIFT